jgi:predicted dehydrogenase
MGPIRFITLNPGHFHAALVQKRMYDGVDPCAHVYARLGPDLAAHVQRLAGFNTRADAPTQWRLEIHAGPDYLERFAAERPGDVAIIAGRNDTKIDAILAALRAGLHVLADKPWVIVPGDLPKLREALALAERSRRIAHDIMTERYEITSILQRELVQDAAVFGAVEPGSPGEPGVRMESVHFLKKCVAGAPLRRPAWFFDIRQQGEGLSDVGTHLVDLVPWVLFPGRPIDAASDVRLLSARRAPTLLEKSDFEAITGEPAFPPYLHGHLNDDRLAYFCNTEVDYTVCGVHVRLDVRWGVEAEPGTGDTHRAVFRGSRARVEIRQGRDENFVPELYVVPGAGALPEARRALCDRIGHWQAVHPGVGLVENDGQFRLSIPAQYRVGHEAHFAEVTDQFLRYVRGQDCPPAWEAANLLAKYTVTTHGVDLARRSAGPGA